MRDNRSIPLGLYVHLPWCLRKCPYCDFNSHESAGPVPESAYVTALLADLESSRRRLGRRRFTSVYFGGGTPSLFSTAAIARVLDELQRHGLLIPDAEISLEANPGAVDQARFAGYRAAGVNRLSLGVQSFDDGALRALGRVHDGVAASRAVELAARHFENFNLDLMYGLPGQSPEAAAADIERALASGAPHLSCYELTIEPNTLFHKRRPALPAEADRAVIEDAVLDALAARGYEHYEVSAHALPGRRCRHNLNYWRFGDYLGIGAGAHSKLTVGDRVWRESRLKRPAAYLRAAGTRQAVTGRRSVSGEELLFEFMLNALRLRAGFRPELLEQRTGLVPTVAAAGLRRCVERGLLESDATGIRATAAGQRLLNLAIGEFLPGEGKRPDPAIGVHC